MKAQDIDRIANAVVGSLAGARDAGLLGCGAISSTVYYTWQPGCTTGVGCEASYECGGQELFTCCAGFACLNSFRCPEPAGFWCQSETLFTCSWECCFDAGECVGGYRSRGVCCHGFGEW